jgi:anti-sigma factor RsiW
VADREPDLDCRDFVELVTEYIEGVLAPHERSRVEAHMAICSGCADYLAQIRETVRLSGSVPREELGEATRGVLQAAFQSWARER